MFDDITVARFWSKVDKRGPDECWPWTARQDERGRGKFDAHGKSFRSHRFSLGIKTGEIIKDMEACHTCDNPNCVNPKHLWWGTHTDNMQDMLSKGRGRGLDRDNAVKTHCPRGHPYEPPHLYIPPSGIGRYCITCINISKKLRREKAKMLKNQLDAK